MEPFIRVDQFNFIARQAKNLVNGHTTSKDIGILNTIKSMAIEKVLALFPNLTEEQEQLVKPLTTIIDKEKAELYLAQLKRYVIPFSVTDQGIRKLFPKVKKLKPPVVEDLNLQELCYLSWNDLGSNKKFIVIESNGKLVGVHGTFDSIQQKGICSICNGLEEVGLFLAEKKGQVQGTYTKKGNYICRDSDVCNQNITSLDPLHMFVELLKK